MQSHLSPGQITDKNGNLSASGVVTSTPTATEVKATDEPKINLSYLKNWRLDEVKKKLLQLLSFKPGQAIDSQVADSKIINEIPAEWVPVLGNKIDEPLPSLDDPSYDSLPFAAIFRTFQLRSPLADAMSTFDDFVKYLLEIPGHPSKPFAKQILDIEAAQTELAGWMHVSAYCVNPKTYADILKHLREGKELTGSSHAIEKCRKVGCRLMVRLIKRVEWLLELQTKAGEPFDPNLCLHVVAADKKWMDEALAYVEKKEIVLTDLLRGNLDRFKDFVASQGKKGVQWPHSPQVKKEMEVANFVFRPMLVKRDRCICPTCGFEVSGLRPWNNPWYMHYMSSHDNKFKTLALKMGAKYAQSSVKYQPCAPSPNATAVTKLSSSAADAKTVIAANKKAATASANKIQGKTAPAASTPVTVIFNSAARATPTSSASSSTNKPSANSLRR